MSQILISYGTSYGHTEKVVRRMGQVLQNHGHEVSTYRADRLPQEMRMDTYDAFIVAGSVIGGKHQRYLLNFVRRHVGELNATTSAFISVSGSAKDAPDQARRCADSFLRNAGWRPTFLYCVAGAMAFTRYNWLLRLIMKWISRSRGGPTDTSRDYELTDWLALDRFTAQLAEAAPARAQFHSPDLRPVA
jgi:menaquinone-dependent protoporphyrinogen oxidase